MDKPSTKPLHRMTDGELRAELRWSRNEVLKEKQLNRDLQGVIKALIAGDGKYREKELQRQRPQPAC